MAAAPEPNEECLVDCACCTLLIHRQLHIKCGECPANLCIQCFRMGAEVGSHKRGHNYELVDPKGKPTFDQRGSWGATEETSLLQAAHRFKMGNWGEMVTQMNSDRNPHDAAHYFDKYFIRGPLGQFGLRETHWLRIKKKLVKDGTLHDHGFDSKSEFRHHLILDALRWYDEDTISSDDPHLKAKMKEVTNDYVEMLLAGKIAELELESPRKRGFNQRVSDVDSLDPSSEDEAIPVTKSKASLSNGHSARHMTLVDGLEPENESDEESKTEPVNHLPILVIKKIAKCEKGKYRMCTELRSKSKKSAANISPITLRPKETRSHRKQRSVASGRPSRYKRVIKVDTSSDEDVEMQSEREDEVVVSRRQSEELHGLEKEQDTDSGTSSESEVRTPKATILKTPKTALATPSSVKSTAVRKKRKVTWKSKKMRRLESFEKKMNKKHKMREEQLEQIEEICPLSAIKQLRNDQPRLCMDRSSPRVDRPKIRQDDLILLGYNVDRDEFENESFNEAETLISRLLLNIPRVNNRSTQVENQIKFARIQKYIRNLAVRNARRKSIVEHDKITEFFNFMKNMSVEKKKTASQVLAERTPTQKILAKCQQSVTKDELARLNLHMDKMTRLKERIKKLRELQTKGITSLKGFDKEPTGTKKKKKKNAEHKRKAGLKWKAIQRWHQKQYANGDA